MQQDNNNERYLLTSVRNALKVLQSFTMEAPEQRISDLAISLGLAKSTVSRLMSTLASEGFVIKDPETQKYRLGLSILTLSGVITSNFEITREAAPVVTKLVNELGESAHLAILEGLDTIYIHKVECNHPVKVLTHLGKRNPAYCTSSGKVLLAHSTDEVISQVIENGLHPYTRKTITDPIKLRNALKTIKEQGYALSKDELLDGVTTIAAPLFDYTGKVVAAITVTGPDQRITNHKIPMYVKKIVDASKEASERLGYNPRLRI